MKNSEIQSLADDACNVAIAHIQDKLGVKSGDLAGLYFTYEKWNLLTEIVSSYIKSEINFASEDSNA